MPNRTADDVPDLNQSNDNTGIIHFDNGITQQLVIDPPAGNTSSVVWLQFFVSKSAPQQLPISLNTNSVQNQDSVRDDRKA